jgi:hypothetical protein
LHFASYNGNAQIIQYLLSLGANPHILSKRKMNMIHLAAQGDQPYGIAYFREKGININERDCDGNTPLHWACMQNAFTAIHYLMAYGSDLDA